MTDATSPAASSTAFAGWPRRVGAFIVDGLPIWVISAVLIAAFGDTSTTDSSFSFQLSGFPALLQLLVSLGWFGFNWLYLQGTTGQTVGKKVLGISVVGLQSQRPIGPGLTFARQLCHILDALPCMIGYLWPLWDRENRTFADMIMSTRVIQA